MDFFIWNKQDSVMGLSANVLLNSRLDFLQDDVIVIHKKGDKRNVVMMETAGGLRNTYDIDSNDPNVIGFLVSVILAQEDAQTVKEMLKELDEENQAKIKEDEVVDSYTKLLEELLRADIEKELKTNSPQKSFPFMLPYLDPECNIIDLDDVEDAEDKKITVVLHHAFVSEVADITELKCMSYYRDKLRELLGKRETYLNESDFASVDMLDRQISDLEDDILDSCDATIKIDANVIYQYENSVIIDCENGQVMILDGDVVESLRTSSIEYEKRDSSSDRRYRVHYKTVDIKLNECYNEVKERGNTIFVISI